MFNCVPLFSRQVDFLDKRQCNLNQVPEDVLRYSRSLEELLLDSNHIKELTKPLFRLQKLRILALSDNEIAKVPPEISNLQSLAELDISKNDISDIPENIKFCKNLQYLDISSNPITRLPECIIQLRNLTHLGLNDVSLTKLPSEIGQLTNLEVLELRENLLKSLPQSIALLARLRRLDIGSNEMEMLPPEVGQLTNLQELYLDCNDLEVLPKDIVNLRSLQCLDISENKLLALTDEIGELSNLSDVGLSQNCIEVLPHSIGRLKKLTILKIDKNRLITLTPAIGSCTAMTELMLTENLLTELPSSIGNLKQLSNFNVDKNRLHEVPTTIGSCHSLTVLSLRENFITSLPMEVGKLEKLRVLDVSGNRLQYLPFTLNALSNLHALWLSENQSQPLLKLQTDEDRRTGIKVLTCYLLPQQDFVSPVEVVEPKSIEVQQQPAPQLPTPPPDPFVQPAPAFTGGPKVHFPDVDDQESVDDEAHMGEFKRHDTPHPKHMPKLKGRQIDGHVIQHEAGNKTEKEAPFRVGDARRRSMADDDAMASVADKAPPPPAPGSPNKRVPPVPPPRTTPIQSQKSEEEQVSYGDEGVSEDSTGGYRAKTVSFTTEMEEKEKEDAEKLESRLKRKNTPHPLKGSALTMNATTAQQKVTEILSKSQSNSSSHMVNGDGSKKALSSLTEKHTFIIYRTEQGLGLSIAGGIGSTPYIDNDVGGVYISKIIEGGAAQEAGLEKGDKLLFINGESAENIDHGRVVEMMKLAGTRLELTVLRKLYKSSTSLHHNERLLSGGDGDLIHRQNVDTISTTIKRDAAGLGFNIGGGKGGSPLKSGDESVYISRITKNGPAERDGKLEVGDRILSINGVQMVNARYEDAAGLLSNSQNGEVHLVVQRDRPLASSTPTALMNSPLKVQVAEQTSKTSPSAGPPISPPLAQSSPVAYQRNLSSDRTPSITYGAGYLTSSVANSAYPIEEVRLVKGQGPLGLSIVGGSDHSSHPFGVKEPGVFISKVVADGAAAKSGRLRMGDRILAVNGVDMTEAKHQEAVQALVAPSSDILLKVRHDPQPPGTKELTITRIGSELLGIHICGGVGTPSNPFDKNDEGIFVSEVTPGGAAARDGRLCAGVRLLEVNNRSLLGASQAAAAALLRNSGAHVNLLICDGFDPELMLPASLENSTSMEAGGDQQSFVSLKDDVFATPSTAKPSIGSVLLTQNTDTESGRTSLEQVLQSRDQSSDARRSTNAPKTPVNEGPSISQELKFESKSLSNMSPNQSSTKRAFIGSAVPRPYVSKSSAAPKPSPSSPPSVTRHVVYGETPESSSMYKDSIPPLPNSKPPPPPPPPKKPVSSRPKSTFDVRNSGDNNVSPSAYATIGGSVYDSLRHNSSTGDLSSIRTAHEQYLYLLHKAQASGGSDVRNQEGGEHGDEIDPIVQSRIPSANPLTFSTALKTPSPTTPTTPSGDSHPERLSFMKKIERFQHEMSKQKTGVEPSAAPKQDANAKPPKKIPLIPPDDVRRFKEEEDRKIAAFDPITADRIPSSANAYTSSSIPVVRTKKAENRLQQEQQRAGIVVEETRVLTAAEQRQLDAQKRAAWRQARLKSLEADAAQAELIMETVRQKPDVVENLNGDKIRVSEANNSYTNADERNECENHHGNGDASNGYVRYNNGGGVTQPVTVAERMTFSSDELERETMDSTDASNGDRVVRIVEKRQHVVQHEVETTEKRLIKIDVGAAVLASDDDISYVDSGRS